MQTSISQVSIVLLVGFSAVTVLGQEQNRLGKHDASVVVGYLPDYRVSEIDASVGQCLTDLIFFSVTPEPLGRFDSVALQKTETIQLLKQIKNQHRVRIHLCIGGWNRSQGFAEIASTQDGRRAFAEGVAASCQQDGFAGVDIDWEHPKDALESENYGKLLAEIAKTFKPRGLRLTVAMAGWQTLTPIGFQAVDAVHLMSYDGDGRHSTFEQSKHDVRKLLDAGVPPEKIRLGVPFYGRGIKDRGLTKSYAEIATLSPSSDADEVNGIFFNGPKTVREKTRFTREQNLGGVMVWEIGQDAPGDASLLKIIHTEMTRK